MSLIYSHSSHQARQGFTLIEMMIVLAIIGILAAIAYPNYQKYVIKTKRTDMMTDMQNIASTIESQKLAKGKYSSVTVSDLTGSYPKQGTAVYTVTISPTPLTDTWTITATPIATQMMASDGVLTLNYNGQKCRVKGVNGLDKVCGTADEWRQ